MGLKIENFTDDYFGTMLFQTKNGFVSHIHRKKLKGRAMPEMTRRANNSPPDPAKLTR
jgi:hypothetical protein